jgi:hypothetical protein
LHPVFFWLFLRCHDHWHCTRKDGYWMMMNSKNLKGILDNNILEIISSHFPERLRVTTSLWQDMQCSGRDLNLHLLHKYWHITCTPTCVDVLFTKKRYGLKCVPDHVFHREAIRRIPTKCSTKISHHVLWK